MLSDLLWHNNVYADLGSTVLFRIDYVIDYLDPNDNARLDVYLYNRYTADVRNYPGRTKIAVYYPLYHNCSVIDENKYECVNTSGHIQITVVNVTHDCIITTVLLLYHNKSFIPFLISNVARVDLIDATSTIDMNSCYEKCLLYINEGRNINLTCGWKSSDNVSMELNGHTLARGDGIITYCFDSNRKMNHYIITCFDGVQRVIEINVKYSPVVKASIRPGSSIIECSSNGIFPSVTFDKWEHQSLYGEHIRYIDGMPNGTLILRNTTYQDNGIYVCTVSNDIPDRNGQLKWTGSVEFIHYGSPVFVNDQKEETKFGRIGEDILLSFTLYSHPMYSRFDVIKYNNDSGDEGQKFTSFYTLTETLTIVRYGVTTRMKCQLGLLPITIKDRDDFGIYSAWAANIHGTSFINITILSLNDESYTTNIRWYAIICGCLSTCFVIYIIASHLRNCKNRRVTETSDQTLPLENAYDEIGTVHYQVANLQNSGNSAEQDFSSASSRSSSSNDAVDVGDVLSNGNNRDSDSASSTVAVLPVGYENTYQSVIEVQDRPQSHVYNECDRENVQNDTQSNVPKVADYINLRF